MVDKEELRRRAVHALTVTLAMKRAEHAATECALALVQGEIEKAARHLVEAESRLADVDLGKLWIEIGRQQGRDLSSSRVYSFGRWEERPNPQFLRFRREWRERVAKQEG